MMDIMILKKAAYHQLVTIVLKAKIIPKHLIVHVVAIRIKPCPLRRKMEKQGVGIQNAHCMRKNLNDDEH
jgi:hypothetical protein